MAKFCGQCGTRMNDIDIFCPRCGQRAPTVAPRPAPHKRKTGKSGFLNALIIVLCLMLFVNGTIAGIWFPGFFTEHPAETSDELKERPSETRFDDEGSETTKTGTISDLSVSYTDDEIKNAPRSEVRVSPEASSADCGNIHVDFSYNLAGNDTFTVTTLPEKTDEAAGLRVKAFDFSLSSGQNEFPTDVVITVPRDDDDNETTYWATFNEDTQKWERIYSTLSEDGKNYLVYTDHFSTKAKVSLAQQLYEKLFGAVKGNKEEAKNAIKDLRGLFYYNNEISDATKDEYVFMFDPQSFEQYMDETCVSTLDELDAIIQETPKDRYAYSSPMKSLFGFNEEPKIGISEADVTTAIGGFVETGADELVKVGQLGGKAGQAAAAAGKAGGFAAKGSSVIGPVAFLWSGITIGGKLTNEVTQGKTTAQAFANHKLDTLSLTVSGIGLVAGAVSAPYLAAGCAIAGVGLYAASLVNDSVRDLSVNERVYREYYSPEYGSARKIYYISVPEDADPKKKTGVINKIEDLSPEQDAVLQKLINRYGGLTGYNTMGIAADVEAYKNNPINMEWALALRALYYVNEKQPDKITDTVKEFYRNYASACFNDGWKTYNTLDKEYRNRKGYDDKAVMKTTDSDKENFIENYTNDMMKTHVPIIKDLNETYARKAKAGMAELVSDELHKLMNIKMEFRVIDEAVGDSRKDFARSVYAVDYKSIPGNNNAAENGFKSYQLPMRFDSVSGPIILPSINTKQGYHPSTTNDYLTYTDNFIPRYIARNENKVFTCTFYHYLLMRLPDFMVFRIMKDESAKEIKVPIELKEPDNDGVMRITLNVKGQSTTNAKTYSLKIDSSPTDWNYTESTRATVSIDSKLNVSVSIPQGGSSESSGIYSDNSKCSAINIKAKAQKHAKDYFDVDGCWECYADVKDLKLYRSYNSYKNGKPYYKVRHVITFNGRVKLKCENDHGVIEVVVVLPEYTDEKTETSYYYIDFVEGGVKKEVGKTNSKGYSMSWTLTNS